MASDQPIRVAIIGLGFGAEFIPIYQAYPGAEVVRDLPAVEEGPRRVRRPLEDRQAVHRVRATSSPTPRSTPSTSTRRSRTTPGSRSPRSRPASTSPARCRWRPRSRSAAEIVEAQRKSGKVYMMMETVVYSREYLFVKELYDTGELGRIQFLRGSHQQDMAGWPGYWEGLPPMHYATHCVSPCLAILGKHAEHVVCHGSGRIDEALIPKYGSPFAIETATFKIKDSRRLRRGHAEPVQHRPPVSRELRRLRRARRASSGSRSRARSR